MADDNPYAERSNALLPTTMEIDREAADALTQKSLPDLQAIYDRLRDETDRGEKLIADGGAACACDVAHSTLFTIIGFAINKLDGEGRYRDWMEDDSLDMLADYRSLVAACGGDAGSPATSGITDAMIRGL